MPRELTFFPPSLPLLLLPLRVGDVSWRREKKDNKKMENIYETKKKDKKFTVKRGKTIRGKFPNGFALSPFGITAKVHVPGWCTITDAAL